MGGGACWVHLLALKTFSFCISKEAEDVPTLAHHSLHPESKGDLTSLLSVFTRSRRVWRPRLAVSELRLYPRVTDLIVWNLTWKAFFLCECQKVLLPFRARSSRLHTHTHTTTWTIQPVVLSRSPTVRILFDFVPSHFCHCSTSLSFSCSAALRNQIFCIYFIEIYFWLPPLKFSFSFGLLLKISLNIFDVYFRLKLE